MSYVTTLVISTYYEPDDVLAQIENFSWAVRGEMRSIGTLTDISHMCYGTHGSYGRLYNMGLNYFPVDDFLQHLDTIKFTNPQYVVVVCRDENGQTKVWLP